MLPKIIYENKELELTILHTILANNKWLFRKNIKPHWFYNTENKICFEILNNEIRENKVCTHTKFMYKLKEAKLNPKYIVAIQAHDIYMWTEYIQSLKLLKELYQKRKFQKLILQAQQEESYVDINNTLLSLQGELQNIIDDNDTGKINMIQNVLVDTVTELEKPFIEKFHNVKLKHYIPTINNTDYWVIGADTSKGKTSLALAFAMIFDTKTLIISIEMSKNQLAQRFLAMRGEVNGLDIIRKKLNKTDWTKIHEAANYLCEKNIYIVDDISNIYEIQNAIINAKNKYDIDLVIIDFLTLIETNKKFSNQDLEIKFINKFIKNTINKKLKIPVIMLSQFNRDYVKRSNNNKKPRLTDLYGSHSTARLADIVILIDRDILQDADIQSATLYIAKNRNGLTGDYDINFKASSMLYYNF